MEFPFRLESDSLDRIQSLVRNPDPVESPSPVHPGCKKPIPGASKTKDWTKVRDLKSLSYVLLHEALRTRMPGQAQLNAYNNLLDHELDQIVREQDQPIEINSITNLNNVAIAVTFTDVSIESPVHTEPDGQRIRLYPADVGVRRIPYDVGVSVDLKLTQTQYHVVPPLRNYSNGRAFYAPCLLVTDPFDFNGWGVAVGRATTGEASQHLASGQVLRFLPGVWEQFHRDACARQNRRSKCPVQVDAFTRQLWNRLSAADQRVWDEYCETPGKKSRGMACVKLLVFIGHRDDAANCFVVSKMGKKTIFETYGDVLATLPPYIEQSEELWVGATSEYVYGMPFIRLPCMLGSEYCHTIQQGMEPRMDSGIVLTGSCDKVVIMQQQLGNNRVFMFNQKAGQVIAEVRSAHIGKRRSTSAFRLIISPKDGAYILLPFLKRASGTDVRVHIVDFMRLLWEYDVMDDPDLEGLCWAAVGAVLAKLKPHAARFPETPVTYMYTEATLATRPTCLGILRRLNVGPKLTAVVWIMLATPVVPAAPPLRKKKAPVKKKSKPIRTPAAPASSARVRRVLGVVLALMGRRTIRTLDAATSVLDLSFFGLHATRDLTTSSAQLARYVELRTFLRDTTTKDRFERSAGQILDGLAVEGARERTISAQRSYVLNNVLRSEMFPHLGSTASVVVRREKLFYAMCQLFVPLYDLYTGRTKFPSDKDSMGNKRLDNFDEIIGTCFRQQSQSNRGALAKLIQTEADAGVHIDSKLLYGLIANKRFENSIRFSFSTGKTKPSDKRPGGKKSGQNGSGGVQQTSGNVMARISHLRRVRHAHINADNKAIKPRMVHQKDIRRFCPGESPEGNMCGLLKNLALLVHVTVGTTSTDDLGALVHCLVPPQWIRTTDELAWDIGTTLVVNGVIKGYVYPPAIGVVRDTLRLCRRSTNLSFETSIYLGQDGNTLFLDSNAGRTMDVLLITESILDGRFFEVCESGLNQSTFVNLIDSLVAHGCAEYICANEETECWIASSWADWFAQLKESRRAESRGDVNGPMFTHLMVHAVAIFDYAIASMIFPESNQGPRNTYQAKMLTQALCLPDRIMATSSEGTKYYLNYAQAPLVESATCLFDGLRSFTGGVNCVTALMRYAFDMEDAIVINQAAVDRGLFHMTYGYNLIIETEKNQQIELPNMRTCRNIKQANYSKLDPETGIIRAGTDIQQNDVLVGLTAKVPDFSSGGKIKIDVSLIYTKKIPARITEISRTTNRFGDPLINFAVVATNRELPFPVEAVRQTQGAIPRPKGRPTSTRPDSICVPKKGEKFASRSAQKGVAGLLVPECDLPFVDEGPNMGMRPDIIVSPDAVPSRMTMGSPIIEMLLGVLAAVLGIQIDGTPFSMGDIDPKEIGDMLEAAGQNRFCEEHMRSGTTGEIIRGEDLLGNSSSTRGGRGIAMGIVYMQRLAHFVAAKIHSRNGGPLNDLTRQPTNGRAKNGGLRAGTMEVDSLVAHGASALLRERLLLASDNHYAPACRLCGLLAETSREGTPFCRTCGLHGTCETIQLPYAAKVMMHLYQAAHMPWRLKIAS